MKKLLGTIFTVAVFFSFLSTGIQAEAKSVDIISKGIYIDELDVSGMTAAEAESAVNELIEQKLATQIVLKCADDNEVIVTPADLGMEWDNKEIIEEAVSMGKVGNVIERYKFAKDLERENYVMHTTYSYDKALIQQLVEEECTAFNQDAVDMKLQRSNGAFVIVDGKQGKHLDNEKAVSMIYDYIMNEWDGSSVSIELPVIVENPRGSKEELAKVKDVLGSYTTSYTTSSAARVGNVENGTRLINGVTLYPGETFSMLELVTPFSVANGYFMAGSYLNGLVVDSLGGGICQVSTTLYNAVLRAELEITQRSNHSMSVAYVPLSADAAIAESAGKDFCFTNNTDYPIYVEGITTADRQVIFNIYGVETRKSGRTVDYISEVIESIQPTTENIIQLANQPIGYAKIQAAHVGYKARLIKVVYDNGIEVSREVVNKSTYKMVPRTASIGMATADPNALVQMQAAISTGSIDHVCAVANVIAAQNMPPQPEVAPQDVPAMSTEIVPDI